MQLFALPLLTAANHLLRAEPWARERLAPFAGRVAALHAPPVRLSFTVGSDGFLQASDASIVPAVSITVPLSALPKLAAGGQQAVLADVTLEGDAQFAQAIADVAQQLRWEPEEDLSKLVGDIAAQRMAATARSVGTQVLQGGQRVVQNVAEYLLEEDRQLLRPRHVAAFTDELAALRDAVERLAKRVALLEKPAGERAP
jgi:ubiquinone biosynthesis protein UbiJ